MKKLALAMLLGSGLWVGVPAAHAACAWSDIRKPDAGFVSEMMTETRTSGNVSVEKRMAFVVGMSGYGSNAEFKSLANPARDAIAVSTKLASLGFEVRLLSDANAQTFRDCLEDFAAASEKADMRIFFYAGHGVVLDNKTYLAPIDGTRSDRSQKMVSLLEIGGSFGRSAQPTILLLDACREAGSAGRSQPSATEAQQAPNQAVVYSTSPGALASDGSAGAHSPFATALLDQLSKRGASIQDTLAAVTSKVQQQQSQTAWTVSSLQRPVYLNGALDDAAARTASSAHAATARGLKEKGDQRGAAIEVLKGLPPSAIEAPPGSVAESTFAGAREMLVDLAVSPVMRIDTTPGRSVWGAISPDLARIAAFEKPSGFEDNNGPLVLWEASGPRRVAQLLDKADQKSQTSVMLFSPQGDRVVAVSRDGAAHIWAAADGKEIALVRLSQPIVFVAFADQGRLLLVGAEREIAGWSLSSRAIVWTVPVETVRGVSPFAANDRVLVVAEPTRFLMLDAATGKTLRAIQSPKAPTAEPASSVAPAPEASAQQPIDPNDPRLAQMRPALDKMAEQLRRAGLTEEKIAEQMKKAEARALGMNTGRTEPRQPRGERAPPNIADITRRATDRANTMVNHIVVSADGQLLAVQYGLEELQVHAAGGWKKVERGASSAAVVALALHPSLPVLAATGQNSAVTFVDISAEPRILPAGPAGWRQRLILSADMKGDGTGVLLIDGAMAGWTKAPSTAEAYERARKLLSEADMVTIESQRLRFIADKPS